MKVVIIGGSGLIGTKLGKLLQRRHEVIAASPTTGVNTLTGDGLEEALADTDVVVDVSNSPSFADADVLAFFQTSTRNLLAAEKKAGVGHHVALSVVGADDIPESGYMRAKVAQEQLIKESGRPYTIVRATQFFEFLTAVAEPGVEPVRLSTAPMQPLAADDVAAYLAEVAVAAPANRVLEIAGPEKSSMAQFVTRRLRASNDQRKVILDPQARYFGAVLDGRGLAPRGANPRIGATSFEAWLERSAVRV